VGKTTISISICDELSAGRGKRVLAIDTDAQGGLSALLGCQPETDDRYNLWSESRLSQSQLDFIESARSVIKTNRSNIRMKIGVLDAIPVWAGMDSAGGRVHQARRSLLEGRKLNSAWRDALENLGYDYVVIDTPGSPNEATQTILGMADIIVIPVIPEELSYRMLMPFLKEIRHCIEETPGYSPSLLVVFSKVQFIEGHKEFLDTKPQELRDRAPVQKLAIAQQKMIQRNGFALRAPAHGRQIDSVNSKYRDANYPFVRNLTTEILTLL
jgi:chromosome partitioning protein